MLQTMIDDLKKDKVFWVLLCATFILGLISMIAVLRPKPADAATWTGHAMTKHFEGWRSRVYKDAKGHAIGYGFNINEEQVRALLPRDVLEGKRALKRSEADRAFDVIYSNAVADARKFAGPAFDALNNTQKMIVIDMAYALGYPRLCGFKKFRAAIKAGDNCEAARQIKDSVWYRKTGRRGRHHVLAFQK